MGEIRAYERPQFDWDLSRNAARDLASLAQTVETEMAALGELRDAAFVQWSGPWGREFNRRATDEVANTATTAGQLRSCAESWALNWQHAAIQMNNVVYAEVVMEVKRRVEIEVDRAEREREAERYSGGFGSDIGATLVEAGSDIKEYFTGVDPLGEALKRVAMPGHRAAKPSPDDYAKPSGSFVYYDLSDGDRLYDYYGDNYRSDHEPPQIGFVDQGEFAEARGDQVGHAADAEPHDPWNGSPPPEPEPVSRASLGDDDGYCSINLALIDQYLLEGYPKLAALSEQFASIGGSSNPDDASNAISGSFAAAQNACPSYLVPTTALQTMGLFLQSLFINLEGVRMVREEIGLDKTGIQTVSNALIAGALSCPNELGLRFDQPPGLIRIDDFEFKGFPPNSGFVDDPVCAANGNFVQTEQDLAMPGLAAVIAPRRTYNSADPRPGLFGAGWTSPLDSRLFISDDGDLVTAVLPDGAEVDFRRSGDGFSRHEARRLTLTESADGWHLQQGLERGWFYDHAGLWSGGHEEVSTWSVERCEGFITVTEQWSGRVVTYVIGSDGLVAESRSCDGRRVTYSYVGDHCVGVDRPGGAVRYEIGDDDRIVGIHDADGVALVRNVYDRTGRVISQDSALGRTSFYRYGEHGTTSVVYQDGPTNSLTHDARGNLLAFVASDGVALRTDWDSRDRPLRIRDRKGHATVFDYLDDDVRDLLERTEFPDGSEEVRQWDELDRLTVVVDPGGPTHRFSYTGASRYPDRVEDPEGGVTRFVRDDRGLPVEITDPDGVTTCYSWDLDGQLRSVTNPSGGTATFAYDDAGNLCEVVDVAGRETVFVADSGGRVVSMIEAGKFQAFEYSPAGRPLVARDATGQVLWSAAYGDHGLVTRLTNVDGQTVAYEYDLDGNRTAMIAPDGERYEFAYDALGRMVSATVGDGGSSLQEFDGNGNVVAVVDPDGLRMEREVDELDRTTAVVDHAGGVTTYRYHPSGPVAAVTRPDGSTFSFDVDKMGRVTASIGPDGARTGFVYSPGGRLLARTTAEGRRTSLSYDEAGQLASITSPDGSTMTVQEGADLCQLSDGSDVVSLSFDQDGRVSSWSNSASGAEGFCDWDDSAVRIGTGATNPAMVEVDRRGLVASVTDPAGVVTEFERDLRGRIVSTSVGEDTVEYAYNSLGLVTSVANPVGDALEMQYSSAGRLLSVSSGGEQLVCQHDAGRLTGIFTEGGDPLVAYEFERRGLVSAATTTDGTVSATYDAYGGLASVTDLNGGSTRYRRDLDGLLTGVDLPDGTTVEVLRADDGTPTGYRSGAVTINEPAATRAGTETDTAGRVVADSSGRLHRYDEAGRLVESVSASGERYEFRFGHDGFMTGDSSPSFGARTFDYNQAGQLVAIHCSQGTTTLTYDDRGRRQSERRPDGGTVRYLWNALDQLTGVERTGSDGSVVTRRLRYSGFGRVERIDDVAIGWDDALSLKPIRVGDKKFVRSGTHVHELSVGAVWNDGLGDDPYGHVTGGPDIGLGFRGELTFDGLVVMGSRIYDPSTRVFLSRDPLPAVVTNPGQNHAYSYAWHDPVNHLDPSGLRPIEEGEFDAWKNRQMMSRGGAFVQAFRDDPWGYVAMAAVVVVGVGLMFVPGAQAIGAAILIGVAFSAAEGMHSKDFSPRKAALTGAISGVTAWAGGPIAGRLVDKAGGAIAGRAAAWGSGRAASLMPRFVSTGTAAGLQAGSGLVEGAATEFVDQAIGPDGSFSLENVDPGSVIKVGVTSAATFGAGQFLGAGVTKGLTKTGMPETPLVNTLAGGITDFGASTAVNYAVYGEFDLVSSLGDAGFGMAMDYGMSRADGQGFAAGGSSREAAPFPEVPAHGQLNLMRGNDDFLANVNRRAGSNIDPDGVLDVVAHGGPGSILSEVDGNPVLLSASQAADTIRQDPSYEVGKPVRLLSCATGQDAGGFAQQLAEELGSPVIAPTDVLWAYADGEMVVSSMVTVTDEFGNTYRVPRHPPDGEFKVFVPDSYEGDVPQSTVGFEGREPTGPEIGGNGASQRLPAHAPLEDRLGEAGRVELLDRIDNPDLRAETERSLNSLDAVTDVNSLETVNVILDEPKLEEMQGQAEEQLVERGLAQDLLEVEAVLPDAPVDAPWAGNQPLAAPERRDTIDDLARVKQHPIYEKLVRELGLSVREIDEIISARMPVSDGFDPFAPMPDNVKRSAWKQDQANWIENTTADVLRERGFAVIQMPEDSRLSHKIHQALDMYPPERSKNPDFLVLGADGTAGYVDVLAPESSETGAEAADRAVKGAKGKLETQAEMVVLNLHRSHLSDDEMGPSLIREILVARMQEPGEVDFGKVIVMNGNEIWFPGRGS